VDEAMVGVLIVLVVMDRFLAFHPLQPLTVMVEVGEPTQVLLDQRLTLDAALAPVLARA
jgi:hypothetical protein